MYNFSFPPHPLVSHPSPLALYPEAGGCLGTRLPSPPPPSPPPLPPPPSPPPIQWWAD